MKLVRFRLNGFRNLVSSDIELSDGVNVFFGANGQGKTNLLEAMYYLTHLNSFRTRQVEELVGWNLPGFSLQGEIVTKGLPKTVKVEVQKGKRSAFVDGAPADLVEYFDGLATVLFAPQQVQLIHGNPSQRRKYLDRMVFRRDVRHLKLIREYTKLLKARNLVLRQRGSSRLEDAYRIGLAEKGGSIVEGRLKTIDAMKESLSKIYNDLAGSEEKVGLRYRSSWVSGEKDKDGLSLLFVRRLEANRGKDEQLGFTSQGPHTDDLDFLIDGKLARKVGSQGQLRSLTLAMSVNEVVALKRVQDEPLFLLDDLTSELDSMRREHLLVFIAGMKGQVVVTTTSKELLSHIGGRKEFEVIKGSYRIA